MVFIIVGSAFLLLGIVGIFVPGLPTVPFLLVTLYCFKKGSSRLNDWFVNTEIYRKHLKEFDQKRAMTLRTKIYLTILSDVMMWIAFFSISSLWVRVVLGILFVIKYWFFFFWVATIPSDKKVDRGKRGGK